MEATITGERMYASERQNVYRIARLTKQGFVAVSAASVAVAGGLLLGIRLRFHNHAPQQLTIRLALHQQTADELRRNLLGGAAEEDFWEVLGERGGYGSGLGGDKIE